MYAVEEMNFKDLGGIIEMQNLYPCIGNTDNWVGSVPLSSAAMYPGESWNAKVGVWEWSKCRIYIPLHVTIMYICFIRTVTCIFCDDIFTRFTRESLHARGSLNTSKSLPSSEKWPRQRSHEVSASTLDYRYLPKQNKKNNHCLSNANFDTQNPGYHR